jgi:hypothetical protein
MMDLSSVGYSNIAPARSRLVYTVVLATPCRVSDILIS